MTYKYCCGYCDHNSVNQHYINHLIKKHKEALYNEKTKHTINASLKGKSLPVFTVKMVDDKDNHPIYICFGCNKFWGRIELATKHLRECCNKDRHLEVLKSLKPTEEVIVEGSTNDVIALQERIKTLEKDLKRCKDDIEINKDRLTAFDSLMDFFVEKKDEDFREDLNIKLKEYNPSIDWDDYI